MAKSRKGTAQPFAKGQARMPSESLSAALVGRAANAPNPQDQNRLLAKTAANAAKGGVVPIKGLPSPAAAPAGQVASRAKGAQRLHDVLEARATGDGMGGSVKMPGLADAIEKPANVSDTKTGSAKRKPKAAPVQKTYVSKGEINKTGNERDGRDFATFTVKGKPGEYHEYVDPVTGKKTTKYVPPRK